MDVLCQAKSGQGKTSVYVLSILQQIAQQFTPQKGLLALVICPTCELTHQTSQEFIRFAKHIPSVQVQVLGAETMTAKMNAETPLVLVATPESLGKSLKSGRLDLSGIKYFVVDECDRIFETPGMERSLFLLFLLFLLVPLESFSFPPFMLRMSILTTASS